MAAIAVVVVVGLFLGMAMFTTPDDEQTQMSPIADMLGANGSPTAPFEVFTLTRRATPTAGTSDAGSAGPTVSESATSPPSATPARPPTASQAPRPTSPLPPGLGLAALVGSAYLTPLPAPSG